MKILFCKLSYMKYYKGVCDADQAYNGGEFVREHGRGHEEYNFLPADDENNNKVCYGFVETKSINGSTRNQLHIERINGCENAKNADFVEDVLVVFCATRQQNDNVVVGWYNYATVYRDYMDWFLEYDNGYGEDRIYNIIAKKEDCVLLPEPKRNRFEWRAPSSKKNGYGFGQALYWFADEPAAKDYVNELVKNIKNYRGENWIDKYPEN